VRSRWSSVLAFARGDRAAGVTLSVAAVAALVWANAAASSYHDVWRAVPAVSHVVGLRFTLRDWANQGLLTLFFTVVGLEIRREASSGELASWHRAAAPVVAALAGMAVPAALYALVVHGHPGSGGWGIPMATDVAFAVGALALVGARASRRLRVFLMTLAVADDIASILVLVVFYSARLAVAGLAVGVGCLVVLAVVAWARPTWMTAKLALGAAAWWGLARGGVEAAVVGVAVGALALPVSAGRAWARLRGPRGWQQRIEPWVNLAVLPVFALANAGVVIRRDSLSAPGAATVFAAVLVARLAGKPAGIVAAGLGLRAGAAKRYDPRLPRHSLVAVGTLATVGFTVPLLIIRAALPEGPLADAATLGLLAATVIGVAAAAAVFGLGGRADRRLDASTS